MLVFIPKETASGETRVAATPETVRKMVKAGLDVVAERGCGASSYFVDDDYSEAGATLTDDASAAYGKADVVVKVAPPNHEEAAAIRDGGCIIGFMAPYANQAMTRDFVRRKIASLSMELVPRITRAQKMDALSSQASIAGYKAVLMAACHLPKYFPLLMTAAGTIKPARVVVMGAGVAGLQAIATAKRLGAIVEASDIRPVVQEQIESLGGKFIPLPEMGESGTGKGGYAKQMSDDFMREQRAIVREYLLQANVVITTALIPGRPAPKLVPADVVEAMKPGAVIIDLAVAQGGNCELSEEGKEVRKHGVLIVGHPNLPATVPYDASLVYARNVWALLDHLVQEEQLHFDFDDEVTAGSVLTHDGTIHHEATRKALESDSEAKAEPQSEGSDSNDDAADGDNSDEEA